MVTGASSGIGKATAAALAGMGADVLMAVRDRERGEQAAAEVRQVAGSGGGKVEVLIADLSLMEDVRELAEQVLEGYERLDVLVNNAGIMSFERRVTREGLETVFATNHLAPFLLTNLLLDRIKASAPARIVNVASQVHKSAKAIPWDDLQSEKKYSAMSGYNMTKLMNVLFTNELARRLEGTGVTANSLHPGFPMKTRFAGDAPGVPGLFFKVAVAFGMPAEEGARTSVYLATSPEVANVSGRYFAKSAPAKMSDLAQDRATAERLWDVSMKLCGLS
jgi:NAD(P)-dependent dehydrogenase (short-subunit alcohol dehydrogenase family)